MGFYLLALAIVLTDQVSKAIVVRSMRLGQSISHRSGVLRFDVCPQPGRGV